MSLAEINLLKKEVKRLEDIIKYYESQTKSIHGIVTHEKEKVPNALVEIKVIGKEDIKIRKRSDRLGLFYCSFKAGDVEEDDEITITISKKGYKQCCETIGMSVIKSLEFELEADNKDGG